MTGEVVGLIFPGPLTLTLVFDPSDGHPIGYTNPYTRIGATRGDSSGIAVTRFEDYRIVSGVKFPFKLTSIAGDITDVTVITSIRVNEGVSAADFARR